MQLRLKESPLSRWTPPSLKLGLSMLLSLLCFFFSRMCSFCLSLLSFCSSSSSSSSYSVYIRCCPLSRDGQIHPIPAIARTPSLHFAQFRTSSFFKSNLLCFFLHLLLSGLLQSSFLFVATHFKIQSNPPNAIIISPQHMSIPSNSIRCC